MPIDVGRMIRSLRQERRWSQRELAEKLSMSQQAVAKYEANTARPSYETLEAMADIFNVPITFFLRPEDLPNDIRESDEMYHLRQAVHDNPDMLTMFDLVRHTTPEQLKQAIQFVRFITGEKDG